MLQNGVADSFKLLCGLSQLLGNKVQHSLCVGGTQGETKGFTEKPDRLEL